MKSQHVSNRQIGPRFQHRATTIASCLCVLLCMVGCQQANSDDDGDTDSSTSETLTQDIFCQQEDGVFMRCFGPQPPYQIRLTTADQPDRLIDSDQQEILVPFLQTQTDYTYTITQEQQTWEGAFSTEMTGLSVVWEITGESSLPAIALAPTCMQGGVIVMQPNDGQTLWWTPRQVDAQTAVVHAVRPTFRDSQPTGVLMGTARIQLNHVSWDRTSTPIVAPNALGTTQMHHDVVMDDQGRTYILTADVITGPDGLAWVVDSLLVDDDGEQVSYPIGDHLPLVFPDPWFAGRYWNKAFGNAIDGHHANNIAILPSGNIIISIRHLSLLLEMTGPDAPQPGQIVREIVGAPTEAFAERTGEVAFVGQHSPDAQDGQLVLFDNQAQQVLTSRVLVFDEQTLAVTQQWELGVSCTTQGSSTWLPNGNVLTACPSQSMMHEWEPNNPEPVWTAKLLCGDLPSVLPRAYGVPGSLY